MSDELVPTNRDSNAMAHVINTGHRGFEYLSKNGDKSVGFMIKAFAVLFGAGLAWYNIDAIHHFFETAVATETLLLKGGLIAVGLWVLWLVISNQRFHYLVAQVVDQTIEKVHMWWINRDKFGAAQYGIRRLEGRISVAQQAKGVICGVLEKEDDAIGQHKKDALKARDDASGLEKEITRRRNGSGQPVSAAVAKLTPAQLDQFLQLAKGRLRSHCEFLEGEMRDRVRLAQQVEQIGIITDAVTAKVEKLKTDLTIAQERWDLAKQKLIAAQAAADVIGGPEYQDFQMALKGIKDEAFAFEGQVRRYMDQLDPTVKAYQADQASSDIADDEFYRTFASDFGLNEGDVKSRLQAALPPAAPLQGIEDILGTNMREKQPVPVVATAGTRKFRLLDRK